MRHAQAATGISFHVRSSIQSFIASAFASRSAELLKEER